MAGQLRRQDVLVVLVAVVVRLLVGLSGYSGQGNPPKFGDYEAQRHWMEITTNTYPTTWYVESQINNFSYWPLDYPPLSGFQSWAHGQLLKYYEPQAVELFTSHGYETPSSKWLMRMTVIISDLLIYFPAVFLAVSVFGQGLPPTQRTMLLTALLMQPALILIDHGHFQYNCISIGFTMAAAAAAAQGDEVLSSVMFSCSLNHKQMSLFFAPAFFAHLLGRCLQRKTLACKVLAVGKLGITVIFTFAVCWAPCMGKPSDIFLIFNRIFPVKRGLYEDYVSNFWCATSVIVKWRELIPQGVLLKACAGSTLTLALPSMVQQIRAPSPMGLLRCMANSALSFYMFSFQVHEKSILLPLLPLTMMAAVEPALALWTPLVACFSMFPLLVRDGVAAAYVSTMALYVVMMWPTCSAMLQTWLKQQSQKQKGEGDNGLWQDLKCLMARYHALLELLGVLLAGALHAAREYVPPPAHLPWLHDRVCITLCFAYLAACFLYLQLRQWSVLPAASALKSKAT